MSGIGGLYYRINLVPIETLIFRPEFDNSFSKNVVRKGDSGISRGHVAPRGLERDPHLTWSFGVYHRILW